jgi:hypothetical protein
LPANPTDRFRLEIYCKRGLWHISPRCHIHSLDDIAAWYIQYFTTPRRWCSAQYSGAADAGTSRTKKGNPVDVVNGNKFESETDYRNAGADPIEFVRSYNSLAGYLSFSTGVPQQFGSGIVGVGWSATYFQSLVPVTVTDGSATYNAVCAFRPDGRVLTFSQYAGVYSPLYWLRAA